MDTKSDAQLLREFATCGVEAAFTELVHRHANQEQQIKDDLLNAAFSI